MKSKRVFSNIVVHILMQRRNTIEQHSTSEEHTKPVSLCSCRNSPADVAGGSSSTELSRRRHLVFRRSSSSITVPSRGGTLSGKGTVRARCMPPTRATWGGRHTRNSPIHRSDRLLGRVDQYWRHIGSLSPSVPSVIDAFSSM